MLARADEPARDERFPVGPPFVEDDSTSFTRQSRTAIISAAVGAAEAAPAQPDYRKRGAAPLGHPSQSCVVESRAPSTTRELVCAQVPVALFGRWFRRPKAPMGPPTESLGNSRIRAGNECRRSQVDAAPVLHPSDSSRILAVA